MANLNTFCDVIADNTKRITILLKKKIARIMQGCTLKRIMLCQIKFGLLFKISNYYSCVFISRQCFVGGTLTIGHQHESTTLHLITEYKNKSGERGGSVVECRTPEREVGGSRPTAAVLCPWARHFTPRKYWLITQEAVAPSRHDWKIVDWDVKPQHKQTNKTKTNQSNLNFLSDLGHIE